MAFFKYLGDILNEREWQKNLQKDILREEYDPCCVGVLWREVMSTANIYMSTHRIVICALIINVICSITTDGYHYSSTLYLIQQI